MTSLYLEFKTLLEKYRDNKAVCWKENNKWKYLKYDELLEKIDNLANAILKLGLEKRDKIALMLENRPEWLMSDLAINKIGATSVPIHITCRGELVEYILKDSESKCVILSESLYSKHRTVFDNSDLITILITSDGIRQNNDLYLFEEVIDKERDEDKIDAVVPEDDIASIIYTSGTTGDPKGVMLTNRNLLSNIESARHAINVYEQDKFLSFLPLSHVLERMAGSYVPMFNGASISYVDNINKLAEFLMEVRPTIIICVPKIFEKMHEKIFSKFEDKKLLKKFLYWSLKKRKKSFGLWLADKIIYKKIRKIFGGRLRFAISGGASINESIIRFFQKINIQIVEGYGLTETSPLISVNRLGSVKVGSVGRPVSGVSVKISEDKEILVKGDNIMKGYWKRNDEKIFDDKGWLRTGDLGFLDKNNFLTITGRKKDIIVTSNGKNIMPEKIESLINLSSYIDQSVVVGHGRNFLSALVTTNNDKFKNIDDSTRQEVIQKELESVNKRIEKHEQIKDFRILNNPFTVEKNELTPTLKIKRKIIEAAYSDIINDIYNK